MNWQTSERQMLGKGLTAWHWHLLESQCLHTRALVEPHSSRLPLQVRILKSEEVNEVIQGHITGQWQNLNI